MKIYNTEEWKENHDFLMINTKGERRTQYVLFLTLITMLAEITAGIWFGSMALLADGWHMATHAAAFFITLFAYNFAKKHEHNPDYSYGTGKVSVLGGYSSAVALAIVAMMMLVESIQRLLEPNVIRYNEAMMVAGLGLLVNLLSAFLLKDDHQHQHGNEDHHHDHNLKAAYFHVLADALTSILAIGALMAGKWYGFGWMDPAMGIVGAVIIVRWGYGLMKQTGPILLDASIGTEIRQAVVAALERDPGTRVTDLHIWKISADHYAAILSVEASDPKPVAHYRTLLKGFKEISHLTIEVS